MGLGYDPDRLRTVLTDIGFDLEGYAVVLRSSWSFTFFENLLGQWWNKIAKSLSKTKSSPKNSRKNPQTNLIEVATFSVFWFINGRPLFDHSVSHHLLRNRFLSFRHLAVRHHLSHAANAVFTSPFESCLVMVLDGKGEKYGSSYLFFDGKKFNKIYNCTSSLGFLYAAVTTLCGFSPRKGEEWKVMGLAAYGEANEEIENFFAERTQIKNLSCKINIPDADFKHLSLLCGGFRSASEDVFKAAELAASFQKFYTDTVCQLASNLYESGFSKNLAFAGGCALNSSTNGEILSRTGFKNMHVPYAPADDGNALGCVLYERYQRGENFQRARSPYLGSTADFETLEKILAFGHIKYTKFETESQLVERVVESLVQGEIIGWMQGRAEFGPRALGNRSILADPRDESMKEKINALVKFREDYRPIAPSILHEFGATYFENYQFSPYMERTLVFKKNVRNKVPAVVHRDGTGRLQSVTAEFNSLYHKLITCFYKRTGIPMLVNTSLNVMGKPIVHSVQDLITQFYSSGMQKTAVGLYLLEK